MNAKLSRELTTLEYFILGILSIVPQSGYSVIGALESGVHRWSASPGAIYPALKRLEQQEIISGSLEIQHETRPRKIYSLTAFGEDLLDNWLRAPLSSHEVMEEHDIVLLKFLFLEKRMTRAEVLAWLDAYEQSIETYDATRRIVADMFMAISSIHQQLSYEAILMELDMQRRWIGLARARLQADANSAEDQSAARGSDAHKE
jgi:DNA-binding PadR family transcriptional regulator